MHLPPSEPVLDLRDLYSKIKFAWTTLRAPFLYFLIKSIVVTGGQPLFTSASATSSGARPSPATQCTPIRFTFSLFRVDFF